MFYFCKNYECDQSNWDVSKVEDMKYMFAGCDKMTILNWY